VDGLGTVYSSNRPDFPSPETEIGNRPAFDSLQGSRTSALKALSDLRFAGAGSHLVLVMLAFRFSASKPRKAFSRGGISGRRSVGEYAGVAGPPAEFLIPLVASTGSKLTPKLASRCGKTALGGRPLPRAHPT